MDLNSYKTIRLFLLLIFLFQTNMANATQQVRFWPNVKSWVYWLDSINPEEISNTDYDLAVIDYSVDGSESGRFSKNQIEKLKIKPDGGRRYILAYMSIGEAENYRYYWNEKWLETKPAWLDKENPDWKGNYKVRYWNKDWQRIIFGDWISCISMTMK